MPIEINLLPKEKTVDKKTLKITGVLNKFALGLTVIFLLVVAVGGGIYFLMSRQLADLKVEQERYTNNIQNLQSTEAGLILLRDRVQKAESILSSRTTEQIFEKQQSILSSGTEAVKFNGSEINASESTIELTVLNSKDLLILVNNLLAQNNFSSLIMNELSFNTALGYDVIFNVN